MANSVSWLSVKPAAFSRAAMRSAASVQLPDESVVLVSTSSLKSSRKATWSGRSGVTCACAAPAASSSSHVAAIFIEYPMVCPMIVERQPDTDLGAGANLRSTGARFETRTPASYRADPDAHLPRTCRPCMTERYGARTEAPRRSPERPERPIAREVDPREAMRPGDQRPGLGERGGRRTRRRRGVRARRWLLIHGWQCDADAVLARADEEGEPPVGLGPVERQLVVPKPAINVGLDREESAQFANVVLEELRQPLGVNRAGNFQADDIRINHVLSTPVQRPRQRLRTPSSDSWYSWTKSKL